MYDTEGDDKAGRWSDGALLCITSAWSSPRKECLPVLAGKLANGTDLADPRAPALMQDRYALRMNRDDRSTLIHVHLSDWSILQHTLERCFINPPPDIEVTSQCVHSSTSYVPISSGSVVVISQPVAEPEFPVRDLSHLLIVYPSSTLPSTPS